MTLRRLLHHPRLVARAALWAARAAAPYAAAGLVLLALALGATRWLLGTLPERRAEVEAWVAQRVGQPVSVGTLRFGWSGWDPEIALDDLAVYGPSRDQALRLARVALRLDLLRSLGEWAPRVRAARVEGLGLTVVRGADGTLFLRGLGAGGDTGLAAVLLRSEALLELRGSEITWVDEARGMAPVRLTGVEMEIRNQADRHVIRARADLPGGQARLALDAEGDLLAGGWRGRSHVQVQGLSLARWIGRSLAPLVAHSGAARLELWVDWNEGRASQAVGSLGLRSAALEVAGEAVNVREASARLRLERTGEGWHGALADLLLRTDRGEVAAQAVETRLAGRWPNWRALLYSPAAALEAPGDTAPANGSGSALGWLLASSPRAGLREVWARYDPDRSQGSAWGASLWFDGAGLRAAHGLPGVTGLAGRLRLWDGRGEAHLGAGPVRLEWPEGLSEPITLTAVSGPVVWEAGARGWRVGSPELTLTTPDFALQLAGSAGGTPSAAGGPYLSLLARSDGLPLPALVRYLPRGVMKPRTYDWLAQAFPAGRATGLQVLVHGPLAAFPYVDPVGRFEARVEVEGATLSYEPRWPPLTGVQAGVAFLGPGVRIDLTAARMHQSPLLRATGEIAELASEFPWLRVEGQAEPTGPDTLRFIREGPLDPAAKDRFRDVAVEGTLGLDLKLDVPLAQDDPQDTRFEGRVTFRGNRVLLREVPFTGASGSLTFTRERFVARGLRAQLAEIPVTVSVEPGASGPQPTTRLRVAGSATVEQLGRALGGDAGATRGWSALKPRLRGSFPWQAEAEVAVTPAGGPGALRLLVETDLRGLEVTLPAPLGKAAGERRPLRVETTLGGPAEQTLRVRLADQLAASVAFAPSAGRLTLQGADVRLGAGAGAPAERVPRGIAVSGELAELTPSPWLELAEALGGAAARETARPAAGQDRLPARVDLTVGRVELGGFRLGETRIGAQTRTEGGWLVTLQGPEAAGSVSVPAPGSGAPYRIALERLALVASTVTAAPSRPPDPSRLPAIEASLQDLRLDGRQLGALTLSTGPTPGGLAVRALRLEGPDLEAQATGDWIGSGDSQTSRLDGELKSPDLGRFLKTLGFNESGLEGGRVRMQVQARWDGNPAAFSLAGARGVVALKIRDGALTDVSPGAGRVFGLLSVQALPRRLTLDFRDLFGKGFRYQRIDGTFRVEDGDAYTEDLVVEGDAARIDIRGRVGLAAEDYDQHVTVMPRLSTTLPIAGALAGGPIGAVAGFVAGQVFKDQIDRAAQFQYTVTGPWSDPVVERVGATPTPAPSATD
ncbi:MAG: TIGR02099 family protein [Gammaproteobacteria bacterium]|nr:TIGR02099 family protein [Gammaproteobacteria bacterium]